VKLTDWILLFVVIVLGATIANLIALKIAGDQVQSQLNSSPLAKFL